MSSYSPYMSHSAQPRPSKKLDRTLTFSATSDMADRVDEIAEEDDRTRSYVVRRLVERGLESEEEGEATGDGK